MRQWMLHSHVASYVECGHEKTFAIKMVKRANYTVQQYPILYRKWNLPLLATTWLHLFINEES